ncbi:MULTISPECIES: TetR/AcrR family transcriptional regulator [unclassified Adlercreutzia]|uniref:TetR/AcrR family transcriptional regulator n=1 Tax=unclassified Adlercreutzia TaxID=2636013 RepID=UPI0013EA8E78|nr:MULTISPECIES: TetR/AcrR family transcriptional regulator [unclassified Adlercreutzia]
MAKKDPQRRARTRKRIIDAFWLLAGSQPMGAVSVSAVVKEARVNRSTFYEYFSSAITLREAAEDELLAFMREKARGITQADEGALVEYVGAIYAEQSDKLRLLLGPGGNASFVMRLKEALRPVMAGLVPEGMPEQEAQLRLEFALSGMIAAYSRWFQAGESLPVGDASRLVKQMVMSCVES